MELFTIFTGVHIYLKMEGGIPMKKFVLYIFLATFAFACFSALAESPSSATQADELLASWRELGRQLRENGSYPFVELKKGSAGEDVHALQERLTELRFYTPSTGEYDKTTIASMKAFQKAMALKQTGDVSTEDQILLFGPNAIMQPDVEYIDVKPGSKIPASSNGKLYLVIHLKIKNNTGRTITKVLPDIKAYAADGSPIEQTPDYLGIDTSAWPDQFKGIKTLAECYSRVDMEIGPGETATKAKDGTDVGLMAVGDVKHLEIAIIGYESTEEGMYRYPEDQIKWLSFDLK